MDYLTHILRLKSTIESKQNAIIDSKLTEKKLAGKELNYESAYVSSLYADIESLQVGVVLMELQAERSMVYTDNEYYWKKFEELLPDLLNYFSFEAIVEAVEIEVECRREKEVELNELAEGRKPEDYGVPRGS
jgi:hypothetical protein|tara:strand:- start:71 stop:469 length:399 start_codon:yes stop_codon:yes gene_type:complete